MDKTVLIVFHILIWGAWSFVWVDQAYQSHPVATGLSEKHRFRWKSTGFGINIRLGLGLGLPFTFTMFLLSLLTAFSSYVTVT